MVNFDQNPREVTYNSHDAQRCFTEKEETCGVLSQAAREKEGEFRCVSLQRHLLAKTPPFLLSPESPPFPLIAI